MLKTFKQQDVAESISYLWHKLFIYNNIPVDGQIIEVAPGYEPKIGNALAMLRFSGIIFLVEPDKKAARQIQKIYRKILPKAEVRIITKYLHNVIIGVDVPCCVDALVASHPFDDMVIASIARRVDFFSQEKKYGANSSLSTKNFYASITDKEYSRGTIETIETWRHFIEDLKPKCFIASQYPSRTLLANGLISRQNSGFIVLAQLKKIYKYCLKKQQAESLFGYKGMPRWWIVAKNPCADLGCDIKQRPASISRLGKSIFVPQKARQLLLTEYDVAYIDNNYFENLGYHDIANNVREFAIVLDNKKQCFPKKIITYADRQKDKTEIGLSGNCGSGRAVYYGDRFNILGVGKTTLCTSTVPSHSTGNLELIGAMRRIVLSRWINYFTQRAPIHPVLIALKETTRRKWSADPIILSLLVRVDDGCLDRPSHIEQSPQIFINFNKTLTEYAKLDAEYFAYRIMLGAWSTSNYSLGGHIIDLESASFVKYRCPYHTSSGTYPHNLFGYEGLGFLRILHQLADVKDIKNSQIDSLFYNERRKHLGKCFLLLMGVEDGLIPAFFSKYKDRVMNLSATFERLAKKMSISHNSLNLYSQILENEDPALLDMSGLMRNIAELYKSSHAEEMALKIVVRNDALLQVRPCEENKQFKYSDTFLQSNAVITTEQLGCFLDEVKIFIRDLFQLIALLDAEKCLNEKTIWNKRIYAMNQNLPTMFELNQKLQLLAERFRIKKINANILDAEIKKLCVLPYTCS